MTLNFPFLLVQVPYIIWFLFVPITNAEPTGRSSENSVWKARYYR